MIIITGYGCQMGVKSVIDVPTIHAIKGKSKLYANSFGTKRPWVRVPSPRPKNSPLNRYNAGFKGLFIFNICLYALFKTGFFAHFFANMGVKMGVKTDRPSCLFPSYIVNCWAKK